MACIIVTDETSQLESPRRKRAHDEVGHEPPGHTPVEEVPPDLVRDWVRVRVRRRFHQTAQLTISRHWARENFLRAW
eukprot:scaffold15130_cov63-Phaeocystis_antarctica.AAC.2